MTDTSKEYIAMCDCPEIQGQWNPSNGDFAIHKYTVFGEELDSEIWGKDNLNEIVILQWRSPNTGYWICTTEKGETRVMRKDELLRETCRFLPDQRWYQEQCKEIAAYTVILYDTSIRYLYDIGSSEFEVEAATREQCWCQIYMHMIHNLQWKDGKWQSK